MGKKLNSLIATSGGIGYLPLAPGTWASGALAVLWFIVCVKFPDFINWQVLLVACLIIGGVYFSGKLITEKEKDPSYVVIDEVAGMAVTLLFIPPTWQNIVAGFILFRLFDILKPLGIKRMEKMKNGWGIMLDDVLAGIYSAIVLRFLISIKIW